jgi:hypothetical protein
VYFGTSSTPPLYVANKHLGPSTTTTTYQKYTIPYTLKAHTRYFWKIVSKTAANQKATGALWYFTTGS